MKNPILNLLFNYKGSISYREFRAGIIILFMLLGTYLFLLLQRTIDSSFVMQAVGSQEHIINTIFDAATKGFTPELIPVWFIISYCSFVLALKRIRQLNSSRTLGIIGGIIHYLFFASFYGLIILSAYYMDMEKELGIKQALIPILIGMAVLAIAGAAVVACLSMRHKNEYKEKPVVQRGLDAVSYSIKLGNVMGIMAIASLIIAAIFIIFAISPIDIDRPILTAFAILYAVCPFVFFVIYSLSRLRHAGISILWLVGIIVVYFILSGVNAWIVFKSPYYFPYYRIFFGIITTLVIGAQYSLFLLPEKNRAE